MPTSGSTDFGTSRNALIEGALRVIGVTAQGETPSATQYTEGADALNMLVKALQADGMPLWAMKEYEITLTATATYRIGVGQTVATPKPLRIISAYRKEIATGIEVPMMVITRDEYNRLGNKTSTGLPIELYYDVQNTYGDIKLFPVPDATVAAAYVVRIVYQRPFEDFDASTDEPDFPQEWYEPLKYLLASRLADEYGVELQLRNFVDKKAERMRLEALSMGSEEGSMYFQPDYQFYLR